MNLNSSDRLVIFLYLVCTVGIGLALRRDVKSAKDFFQAGRALPAWMCGLAFFGVSLGAPELIGMGAGGAQYGLEAAHFFWIGAIPAMVFLALFMMPVYYGSKARSVPEYLGMRFDRKTRAFNACTIALMAVTRSGLAIYLMAHVIQALHVFDGMFYAMGWPLTSVSFF